jgi:hypothetical protein
VLPLNDCDWVETAVDRLVAALASTGFNSPRTSSALSTSSPLNLSYTFYTSARASLLKAVLESLAELKTSTWCHLSKMLRPTCEM